VAAFAFLACGQEDPERTVVGPAVNVAEAQLPIGAETLCMTNRWIGLTNSSGDCPDPLGGLWKKQYLFGAGAPGTLSQYCSYEWPGTSDPEPTLLPGGGEHLDADCMIVPQSDYDLVSDIVRPVLAEAHRRQLEAVPLGSLVPNAPIQVAVIDSWPSPSKPGRSRHGLGLAELIDSLACRSYAPNCNIWTNPFLALNRFGPQHVRSDTLGGTHGGVADAARALLAALPQPGWAPVVGVAAFGWDGRVNQSTTPIGGELRYSMLAMRDVLARAACLNNFLLFAAAGNASGGPEPGMGPIYPAAFEKTLVTCPNGEQRPLIRSVGGLDGKDRSLGNARPGARPVLAAPALAAPGRARVVGNQTVEVYPQTGSSVAAGVAGAIAAMVWSLDPGMPRGEVLEAMEGSATELQETADYCAQKPCGNILRLSMCDSLEWAGAPLDCEVQVEQVDKYAGENAVLDDFQTQDVFQIVVDKRIGTNFTEVLDSPACEGLLFVEDPSSPPADELICPSELLYSDAILASTDPHDAVPVCPACHIFYNSQDEVVIDMVISRDLVSTVPVVPATLNYLWGGEVVSSYGLVEAEDGAGNRLGDGVLAGRSYRVGMPRAEDPDEPGAPLEYQVDFDAVSIEWVRSDMFATSLLIVDEVTVRP
jgi:hypothetical protein